MALKGTLKDFGIADILQLIGQQGKSGHLHLKSSDQKVQISFKDGVITRAESATRNKKDLIGSMLVRAELISERQLADALETQKKTLRKLGDVLVANGLLTRERFRQMVRLQMTETLYGLFSWKSGTYEFEQADVEIEEGVSTLRAEAVLMEGVRIFDEWPMVKKVIHSYGLIFDRLKELPAQAAVRSDDELDDVFGEGEEKKSTKEKSSDPEVGDNERQVFQMVALGPARDVRKLIDLSCLGEFETCKALFNLVREGYLKPRVTRGRVRERVGGMRLGEAVSGFVLRVGVFMAVLAAVAGGVAQLSVESLSVGEGRISGHSDPATETVLSGAQLGRIRAALAVFQLERDEVPETLEALVESGLLHEEDLRYPWHDRYYYRRVGPTEFVLLPPFR